MEGKNWSHCRVIRGFLWDFIYLLGCMYLMGGFLPAAVAFASEESEILLARGNKLYLDGKYIEAKDYLIRAVALDRDNPEIWSLIGTTELSLQDYQAAKDALTKTVALDPNFPRGKLYLGVANYYLGNYKEAELFINEAKELAPKDGLTYYYLGLVAAKQGRPKDALTNLEMGMSVAPQIGLGFKAHQEAVQPAALKSRPFYVNVTSGLEYDSNVKVLPDKTTISALDAGGNYVGQYKGHKADWRTPLILSAGYEPVRNDQWTIGISNYGYVGLNYYLDNFNVYEQFNEIYVKYRLDRLTINPYYTFDYTWLGGQPWSLFNSGGLRLTLDETNNIKGDLIYMFSNRDFKNTIYDNNYDRTGNMNQVGFFQTVTGGYGTVRAGFVWQREVTNGINFTANKYRFPLEGYLYLPWNIMVYSYFEYAKTICSNRDSFANKYRQDDYIQVVFQLRRPVTSWMTAIVGYTHISNPSNLRDYQYNRDIYQLLATFNF
jgi:tetratricopeptide (TPR) repeat protein